MLSILTMSNINIDWSDAIKKEARGIDGEDLGEVQNVEEGHVVVQKGLISKEKFYIPKDRAVSYDGSVVKFSISEDEMKSLYTEIGSSTKSEGKSGGQAEETKTIPLTEEKLEVSKKEQQEKMKVTKQPVTRTETKEVPVTHEEISIERRQPGEQTQAQEPVSTKQEMEIPVKKEEVEVKKTPYVKEEVEVKKKPVTETKEVKEEVKSEEVKTSGP